MDKRAIGVFDSGLGGLTAVKELMRLLPSESIVYFGDTGRVPYGTKSNETILRYTKGDIEFLKTFDLKAIIVACGTASTIALPQLDGFCEVPMFGVSAPAARAAKNATKNGKIGVIGTPGTIASGGYEKLLLGLDPKLETVSAACPLFVPLAEEGWQDHEIAYLAAKEYLAPICAAGVDTLILGCTHYPLLSGVIRKVMGDSVTLINPGAEAAKELRDWLGYQGLLADEGKDGEVRFFASDCVDSFVTLGSRFLERPLTGCVERVDIEKYTPRG
ncbi:MAG: glutamate racemase [Clostridia bacterium]|nr:glutamate racemase [Clostridia bacterium]